MPNGRYSGGGFGSPRWFRKTELCFEREGGLSRWEGGRGLWEVASFLDWVQNCPGKATLLNPFSRGHCASPPGLVSRGPQQGLAGCGGRVRGRVPSVPHMQPHFASVPSCSFHLSVSSCSFVSPSDMLPGPGGWKVP